MTLLDAHQAEVADVVLAEESARRDHLVVALSGAHAYGFPSPDSDLDLKAIHMARTSALLGLKPGRATFDRMEVIDGVEIDYTSNELQMVLAGILAGNGNYLERVLGPIVLQSSPELGELRPLAERAMSRRLLHHYRGFASGQLKEAEKAAETPAKKVLYVIRTALTGIHALATGKVVTDVTELLEGHGMADAMALVEQKRRGERTVLTPDERTRWLARVHGLFARLDEASRLSVLPEEPGNEAELEAWLLEVRRRRW
jgi:hypothetical protein